MSLTIEVVDNDRQVQQTQVLLSMILRIEACIINQFIDNKYEQKVRLPLP